MTVSAMMDWMWHLQIRPLGLHDWFVLVAAGWYIQYSLRWLQGPFNLFEFVRRVAGIKISPAGGHEVIRDGMLAQIFMCIYCLSFWVSILLIPAWLFAPILVYPFAGAGLIALYESFIQAAARWR